MKRPEESTQAGSTLLEGTRGSNPVPAGWERARLSEIAEVRLGRQRSPERAVGVHMRPYLRAANVTWAGIDVEDVKEMDFRPEEAEVYELRPGDILLSEASGSASEVGKPAVWRNEVPGACFQNTLIRVRAPAALVPFLHRHFLNDAHSGAFAAASRGVGIHHLGAQTLSEWQVRVPPLAEQRRIVEALDSYISRLDAAAEELKRVEANLKRYRASVLKAAVEGRLVSTEAALAKKEGREYEPASVLLARILKERRHRWEQAELAKMKAKGEVPKNDKWKGGYEEPERPDTSGLPELPPGWCWASVSQLDAGDRRCAYGVLVPGSDVVDGVPLVRVGDLDDCGRVTTEGLKKIARGIADQFKKTYLRGGEVLLSLVGTIGRTAVVPHTLAGANVARAIGVLPVTPLVRARWVELWFRSPEIRSRMIGQAHEVARKTLNLENVRAAVVALPPVEEQARIEVAVEDAESVAKSVEYDTFQSLQRIVRLRQAILRWAFEGKLVEQDPKDEPAAALLERLRRQQAGYVAGLKTRQARQPKRQTA